MGAVLELCNSAVLLHKGRAEFYGLATEAADRYEARTIVSLDAQKNEGVNSLGVNPEHKGVNIAGDECTLTRVAICSSEGDAKQAFRANEQAYLHITYAIHADQNDPHVGFKIRDNLGLVVFETNTYCMNVHLGPRRAGSSITLVFEVKLAIAPGEYTVTCGLAIDGYLDGAFKKALSFIPNALAFSVASNPQEIHWSGRSFLPVQVRLEA
jgi:lipopolysaccharide transport system ATP-binding protein